MNLEEKILIDLLKDNSTQAFDSLYKKHSARLYNFVLKISNQNRYLSEEIVQRVFIKIWETRQNVDSDKSFISYLSTIAHNMLMNEFNHDMVEYIYRYKISKQDISPSVSFEDKIEYSFLSQYLNTLINQLPQACKEVYKLSRLESYTNKEIAVKLNKSESTVEKQLAKANDFVRKKIKQNYDKIFIFLLLVHLL